MLDIAIEVANSEEMFEPANNGNDASFLIACSAELAWIVQ